MKELRQTYYHTIILCLAAVPLGLLIGIVDAVFGIVLLRITALRMTYAYWLIPFLAVGGVLMTWVYQRYGAQSIRGMALIFETGHGQRDAIPKRLVLLSIAATWLTHLCGGSAGREGVAIQLGGAIAHQTAKYLRFADSGRLLLITGMAAGFAGLFRTPLAATFFALEVLTAGVLKHQALLPALTAALTASWISGWLGLEKFTVILNVPSLSTFRLIIPLLILGIIFGFTGGLFAWSLQFMKKLLTKWFSDPLRRIFFGGLFISACSLLLFCGRYSGLGTNLIGMSFTSGIMPWDFLLKAFLTIITIAAGFQGGEVTPLFAIGAALGASLAGLLGLPVMLAAALGYAAVFASGTNTLLAPMLIGAEVFGYVYLPYFIIVCAIAYACNGNYSIYPLQQRY